MYLHLRLTLDPSGSPKQYRARTYPQIRSPGFVREVLRPGRLLERHLNGAISTKPAEKPFRVRP